MERQASAEVGALLPILSSAPATQAGVGGIYILIQAALQWNT
jgi:hypothetical protein